MTLVSVFIITYNHEAYIRESLDGILMQKTNFDFEVVVGEDCSTDNTRKILLEYDTKHPGKFKLLLHKQNIGAMANQVAVLRACIGKYISMCEGDDYWTDPLKLQKQVDFLEENPDFGLVHSDNDVFYESKNKIVKGVNNLRNKTFSNPHPFNEILLGNYEIHTLTVLFRRNLLDKLNWEFHTQYKMGDLPLWLTFANKTKFYYFNESTAMYRVNMGSASQPYDIVKRLEFQVSSKKVRNDFAKKISKDQKIVEYTSDNYNRCILRLAFEINDFNESKNALKKIKNVKFKDYMLHIGTMNRILRYCLKALSNSRN